MEEITSIEELQFYLRTRYEAVIFLKAFRENHNRFKWNEEDYLEFIEKLESILNDFKKESDK